jgi:hypothetical protein
MVVSMTVAANMARKGIFHSFSKLYLLRFISYDTINQVARISTFMS